MLVNEAGSHIWRKGGDHTVSAHHTLHEAGANAQGSTNLQHPHAVLAEGKDSLFQLSPALTPALLILALGVILSVA